MPPPYHGTGISIRGSQARRLSGIEVSIAALSGSHSLARQLAELEAVEAAAGGARPGTRGRCPAAPRSRPARQVERIRSAVQRAVAERRRPADLERRPAREPAVQRPVLVDDLPLDALAVAPGDARPRTIAAGTRAAGRAHSCHRRLCAPIAFDPSERLALEVAAGTCSGRARRAAAAPRAAPSRPSSRGAGRATTPRGCRGA